MRIGVIGPGAVGGALAALLDRAGHELEVIARPERAAIISASGLLLRGARGEHLARVRVSERLSPGNDLVILATKAQDAQRALRDNAATMGRTDLVVIQNGIGVLDDVRELCPEARVLGGLALFASSLNQDGSVTMTAAGPLYLGGGSVESTRRAAAIMTTALPTHVVSDFTGAQWTKLLINQVNALPAITGLSAQDTIEHPGLRRIIVESMRETVRACFATGHRFARLGTLTPARIRLFAVLPKPLAGVLPLLMARRMGETPNPGSTLQSIRRGRSTEIDYLNGAVVRAAETAGITAPVNDALLGLVHETQSSGQFLSPEAVMARVP